jgi:hypothetical protein
MNNNKTIKAARASSISFIMCVEQTAVRKTRDR